MIWSEALEAMKLGHKVSHRYFSVDEWMELLPDGNFRFEDGVVCNPSLFWFDRSTDDWKIDWEIYEEL